MTERCRACGAGAASFAEAVVLGKHRVRYFRCAQCGFVQTEAPYWLKEAYQDAISALDVGAVSRNLRLAPTVEAVIRKFFNPDARFIDYGGGSGLFVRLMRDAGFDFWWADKYATNVYAKGFEAESGRYELLTAFEVFEHLEEPVVELERMLQFSRNLLFTTVLLPSEVPRPGTWWYYGLEHGQHISFHTLASLSALGRRFGLALRSSGELHLLTDRAINERQFRAAIRSRRLSWFNRGRARQSLVQADYERISQRLAGNNPAAKGSS